MRNIFKIFILGLLLLNASWGTSQKKLSGFIMDENDTPIPFVEILVKNDASQRTIADLNGYYEMRLLPGEYFLVFRSVGYKEREGYVAITDSDVEKNMQLFPETINEINDVTISVKKSNPGRDIMLKVVERRDTINPWNHPHTCDVYIKASGKINQNEKSEKEIEKEKAKKEKEAEKKSKKESKEESDTQNELNGPVQVEDPFAVEKNKNEKLANSMNLVEVQLSRSFAPYNYTKEIRNAFESRGNTRDLYYTTTVKSNFNFFTNLLYLDDLHHSPVSSPISGPGILSYKYRLVEQYEENGQNISKIKIIPRGSSTSTLAGYIWVIDSLWMIQKLELTLEKGNLILYDHFTIKQEFENQGDTLCVLQKQELIYGNKFNNNYTNYKTVATFTKYNFNPKFSKKYFSNELSVTEKEAYEKDTSYWRSNRTIGLTEEEQQYIITKDSLEDFYNRKEYLDSVDSVFNKITILKVLWFGIDHRNRANKSQWYSSSLANMIEPIGIAGPRVDYGFYYFKKWDNQRIFWTSPSISMGIINKDPKGSFRAYYLFNPFKFGSVWGGFSHNFDLIQFNNAISQVYKRSNFIEKTELYAGMEYELFNGLYFNTDINFSERRNLDSNKYQFVTILDNTLPNDKPKVFDPYQALITSFTLYYIPGQKYMREPYRKVLLGSKWPTIYSTIEYGTPRIFGSDVNHVYLSGGLRQTFKIGTLGTSKYNFKMGQFLNSTVLKEPDYKYHRQSDPYWFSDPLNSFQGLQTNLPSKKLMLEGHFIHHDNGAIVNKIPFMKKTNIGLVGGTGVLYVSEFNYQHYEIFVGLERIFKIGRQRLRIGVYNVSSDGNKIKPKNEWKFSIDFLNDRDMSFNF
jgi:hypothetical protein